MDMRTLWSSVIETSFDWKPLRCRLSPSATSSGSAGGTELVPSASVAVASAVASASAGASPLVAASATATAGAVGVAFIRSRTSVSNDSS